MTLEEKVGQMTQLTLGAITRTAGSATMTHELDSAKIENLIVQNQVGSILNVADVAFSTAHWQDIIARIQAAARRTRLQIPVIYGIDAVHGHNYLLDATIFPQNLAMAATWNPELVRRANEITATEMRATGIRWNFSPVLDLGRQPVWSRFFETFGEDVHLASVMGAAAVEGLQRGAHAVAATGKHFLGYSMPLTGRDRTSAWIPDRMLYEYFAPPFQAAITAGVRTIMVNSGDINGIPVHANRDILTGLLREKFQFRGVVVSDWEDIIRLHTVHHVAATPKEAVRIAIEAGIDMSMVPYDLSFRNLLLELVREGSIREARIDESVRRILQLKYDVGLFDDPLPESFLARHIGAPAFQAVSRSAAEEAITLLKNTSHVLPLAPGTRVLLTGPGAQSLAALHGAWTYSWQGTTEELYPRTAWTLLQALLSRAGSSFVTYVPGSDYEKEVDIAAAVRASRGVDVAVVALAEKPSAEKPGDINDLDLPEAQMRLVRAIAATGKPVVIVLIENRPRIVRDAVDSAAAVVLAYQPGPFGAEAIADVLYGRINPSGRLPFTYPRYANSLLHYDHAAAEEVSPDFGSKGYNPQWDFGHGLSYTGFAYENLRIGSKMLNAGDSLAVSVSVTNTGTRAGKEVVQLYVRDLVASVTPPVKRLRAFRKISLGPGETKTVMLQIPVASLAFVGRNNEMVVEPGEFEVLVAGLHERFRVH